jgi:hypothetical protein
LTDALPEGVTRWDGPGLDAWHPWTPAEVASRLEGVDVRWCVVGGWSIDLFLGEETRPHDDLEIEILQHELPAVRRAFDGFVFHAVGDGQVQALAADEAPPAATHQTWVLDPDAQAWRVDVMRVPGDAGTWVFRRDESVTALRPSMVHRTPEGVPYLAPHGTLLYKAKAQRPKDEADFESCLPRLSDRARTWLRDALTRVHPGHAWIERLA